MTSQRRTQRWGWAAWALCALTLALALPFRYRAITRMSPTYDEQSRLFLSVDYAQTGHWYEGDIHPPVFSWMVARLSPWIAPFRDAETFARDSRNFLNVFQYRLDLLSGLPSDTALIRLRAVLQIFLLVLVLSALVLARHFGFTRWGMLALGGLLLLEPTFLGLTSLVANDFIVCSLLLLATALGVQRGKFFDLAAALVFTLAWGTKFTSAFWCVPLAIGIAYRKIPRRCLGQWLGGALGGYLVTTMLGGFDHTLGPMQAPNFRLTYLDGVLLLRTPLVYFLQAFLCKSSLAVLGLVAWNGYLLTKKPAGRERALWVGASLVVSLLAVSQILPGLGVRLVMVLWLTIWALACARIDTPRVAALVLLALCLESAWHYDGWLAYQNPLAGSEPRLLDSNLDWGQGLRGLADWRKDNPDGELAIAYFGTALPETYGIDEYRTLHSAPDLPSTHRPLTEGVFKGYVAISRNFLYGYMVDDWNLKALRSRNPIRCFQDALCLYDVRQAASR